MANGQQLQVSVVFWQRPAVQTALVMRDIGELFVLLRQYAGASQRVIGEAVGLEQDSVSRIMNGRRGVVAIDVLERIADGCDMPDAARALLGLAPRDSRAIVAITGRDLRVARETQRVSLFEVARRIGRDKGHLSRVERAVDSREVTPALVREYERALDVRIRPTGADSVHAPALAAAVATELSDVPLLPQPEGVGELSLADFGRALRWMRRESGLSLRALSARVNYHYSYIGNIEVGNRRPNEQFAAAVDKALNAHGALVAVIHRLTGLSKSAADRGDDMDRRQLLANFAGALGLAIDPSENVRSTLNMALSEAVAIEDWHAICDRYGRLGVSAPPAEVIDALNRELSWLGQQLRIAPSNDLFGVTARLSTLYGMSLASVGRTVDAVRWYHTAARAARRSGDLDLIAWVKGREVLRSEYDGYSEPKIILKSVNDSRALDATPSVGRMELLVAAARVHARLQDRGSAYSALDDAQRAYDLLPEQEDGSMFALPEWRFRLRAAYVFAMLGDIMRIEGLASELGHHHKEGPLRWRTQIDLNRALCVSRAGDVKSAFELGCNTVASVPRSQHTQTMRQLVLQLAETLTTGRHSDAPQLLEMIK